MKQKNVRSESLAFFVFEGKRPPSQPGMMIKAEKKENGLTDPITGGYSERDRTGQSPQSKAVRHAISVFLAVSRSKQPGLSLIAA